MFRAGQPHFVCPVADKRNFRAPGVVKKSGFAKNTIFDTNSRSEVVGRIPAFLLLLTSAITREGNPMQGAALKLTALAASLAVGFVVLVQTQQSLTDRQPEGTGAFEEAPEFSEDSSSLGEPQFSPVEGHAHREMASHETAPEQEQYEPGVIPMVDLNVASEMPDSSGGDPFASAGDASSAPPSQQEPVAAFRRNNGEAPAAAPSQPAEHDPFAMFAKQAADQFAGQVAEKAQPVAEAASNAFNKVDNALANAEVELDNGVNQAAATVETKTNEIQQVAHEAAGAMPRHLEAIPEGAVPALRAAMDEIEAKSGVSFPGLDGAMEQTTPGKTKEMRLELAQRFPSDDEVDPFAVTPAKQKTKPAETSKSEEKTAEQPKMPAFGGFPAAEPINESTSAKPVPAEPAKIPGGFPKAEPAPLNPADSRPVGFPQFAPQTEPEAEPAADAPEGDNAPVAETEMPADRDSAGAPPAFFGEFSGEEKTGGEDDPYRLIPEFNAKTDSAAPARQPAPFQFNAEPEAPAMTEQPAAEEAAPEQPIPEQPVVEQPAEPTEPAESPEPVAPSVPATPNPFADFPAPPQDNGPAGDSEKMPAGPAEPNGFPALGAPSVAAPESNDSAMPAAEPVPAADTPSVAPSFEAFSTNESAPLSVPMAEEPAEMPAQPRPAPGGFPSLPETEMSQELTPEAEPAPLADTETKPEPAPTDEMKPSENLDDEELLGSAYVDGQEIESVQQPKVELYKSAPENAVLGEPLIYSIEVVNTGDVAVREVRVEDKFPAGTKLTGTIPRAELADKTLLWKFEELKPEERKKILVRVVPIEPGTIGSISTVSYKSVVAAQTIVTAPRLELNLSTSQQEVAIGESVEVTFSVANTGKGAAHNVILRNLIPTGLEHPAGGDLEYEIGTLNGGERKEVTLAMLAKESGEFTNEATLKSKGGVSAAGEVSVRVIPAVMSLTQNGPTRRFVGHAADYEATVKNNSQRTLTQLTVSQIVPAGMEFRSASSGGTFDPVRRIVTWRMPALPSGETMTLQTKLVPRQIGVQELKLESRESGGSFAELALPVKVEGMASLAVRVPDERGPVSKGERVSLKFKVVNRGSAAAENMVVNCRVPAQLKYLSADGASQPQVTPNGVQFAAIPSLEANQEMVFNLVFTAESAGDARVEFEVTAGGLSTPLKHQEQVIVYGD